MDWILFLIVIFITITGQYGLYYQMMKDTHCHSRDGGTILSSAVLSGNVDTITRDCMNYCDHTMSCMGGTIKKSGVQYGTCAARKKCDHSIATQSSSSTSFIKCSVSKFNSYPDVNNVDQYLTDNDTSTCVTPSHWGYETQCVDISVVTIQLKGGCNGKVPTVYITNGNCTFSSSQCNCQMLLDCPVIDQQVVSSGVCKVNYNCAIKQRPQRYGWDRVIVFQLIQDICELSVQ